MFECSEYKARDLPHYSIEGYLFLESVINYNYNDQLRRTFIRILPGFEPAPPRTCSEHVTTVLVRRLAEGCQTM